MKIFIGIILVVIISGCVSGGDPVKILSAAENKAAITDYLVEYETTATTQITDNPIIEKTLTVIKKKGQNKRIETYVRDIVLVQEVIHNSDGIFNCIYGTENITCLWISENPNISVASADFFASLISDSAVKTQTNEDNFVIGTHRHICDRLDYILEPRNIGNNVFDYINSNFQNEYQIHNEASLIAETIKRVEVSSCTDRETGLLLYAATSVEYQFDDTIIYQNTVQQATRLIIDPLLSKTAFEIPKEAEIAIL